MRKVRRTDRPARPAARPGRRADEMTRDLALVFRRLLASGRDTLAALHYLRAGRIGVFLRSIADLFTAKEALRCRGDNRVFWVE